MKSNRLLEVALTTHWAMPIESLQAMLDIYQHASIRNESVTEDDMAVSYADNEDLAQFLHKGGADHEYVMSQGIRVPGTRHTVLHTNGVAVLSLFGPIFPRANLMTEMSGAVSITQFTKEFVLAYNNPDVQGIVMEVDSPGGAVTKIGDSAKIINTLSALGKKPVATFASGFLASASYYIGSAVGKGRVFASELSEVGSIGVLLTLSRKADDIQIVSSNAPMKRPDPATEEGRAALQRRADDLHEIFATDIAGFRGVSVDKVNSSFGKGDVFAGSKAKSMGLIDKVSTIGEVVNMVAREAATKNFGTKGRKMSATNEEALALLSYTDEDIDDMKLGDLFAGIMPKAGTNGNGTADASSGQSGESEETAQGQTIIVQSLTDKTREQLEEEYAPVAVLSAKNLVLQHKILPAERAQAACDIVAAKCDDSMFGGKVGYLNSEGQLVEGTREEAAMARYETRTPHTLTKPAIPGVKENTRNLKATILDDTEDDSSADANKDEPTSDERRENLLKMSSQGRSVLSKGQAAK